MPYSSEQPRDSGYHRGYSQVQIAPEANAVTSTVWLTGFENEKHLHGVLLSLARAP
jgi:hypothetical protein